MSSARNSALRQPVSTSSSNNPNYQNLNLHLQKLEKSVVFTKSLAYSLSCIYNILENGRYGMDYLKVLEECKGFEILTKCCTEWGKEKDINSSDSIEKIREMLEKISRAHAIEVTKCLKDIDAARTINKKITTDIYETNLNKVDDALRKDHGVKIKSIQKVSSDTVSTNTTPTKASDIRTKFERSQSCPSSMPPPALLLDRSSARRSIRGGKAFGLGTTDNNSNSSSPHPSPEKNSITTSTTTIITNIEPLSLFQESGVVSTKKGEITHHEDIQLKAKNNDKKRLTTNNPILLMRSISAKLGSDDDLSSRQSYSSDEGSLSSSKGVYSSRWKLATASSNSSGSFSGSVSTCDYNSDKRGQHKFVSPSSSSPLPLSRQYYTNSIRSGSTSEPSSPQSSITGIAMEDYLSKSTLLAQVDEDVSVITTNSAPASATNTLSRRTSTSMMSSLHPGKTMSSIPEDIFSPEPDHTSDDVTDCGQSLQPTVTSSVTAPYNYLHTHKTYDKFSNTFSHQIGSSSVGGGGGIRNSDITNYDSPSPFISNKNYDNAEKASKMYLLHKTATHSNLKPPITIASTASNPSLHDPVFRYSSQPSKEESDNLVARMALFTKTVSSSHILQIQSENQKRTLRGGGGTSRRTSGMGESLGRYEDSCVTRRATLSAATFSPPIAPLSKG